MTNSTAVAEPISKSDRMELRRIVKARFEVLREQLGQRANELNGIVKMTIEDESKKDIVAAENEGIKLAKKARDLAIEIDAYNDKWEAKGLVNRGGSYRCVKEMENDVIGYFLRDWSVKDLGNRTQKIVTKVKNEHGIHSLELRTNELKILEDLSVDALQSAEAKKFLAEIPEIDNLLPLPEKEARKALVAGV